MDTFILVRGARQLLTLHGPPGVRRGEAMRSLGVIEDGAVLIRNGEIAAVGPTRRLENLREAKTAAVISANGRVVLPGFVDPSIRVHHAARQMSVSYLRTRRRQSLARTATEVSTLLRSALQHGTTRAEVKIGGSDSTDEWRFIAKLRKLHEPSGSVVSTWVLRLNADDSGAAAIEKRTANFEHSREPPCAFVEVETGSSSAHNVKRIVEAATRCRIRCKLRWMGSDLPDTGMLQSAPFHVISGLERLDGRLGAWLARSNTILQINGHEGLSSGKCSRLTVRSFLDQNGALALSSGYDAVFSPVYNMQMSIALAVLRYDLSTEEALTAATVNAAHASGIGSSVGTLEYGKQADLLLLNLSDYRELARQFGVNHTGMVIRSGAVIFNRIGWRSARPA